MALDRTQAAQAGAGEVVERLETVLDEQHGLYTRLEALSVSQSELIATDSTDELLEVLKQRGGVIAMLERSNVEMKSLQGEVERSVDIGAPLRDRLRQRVDGVKAIAQRVAQRDAADEQALAARRDAIADKLSGNTRGRTALSAYGRGAGAYAKPAGARFQDRRA
ncbi:MAG: flagellar export chaperone FlgN [Planctomycetota bacterium]